MCTIIGNSAQRHGVGRVSSCWRVGMSGQCQVQEQEGILSVPVMLGASSHCIIAKGTWGICEDHFFCV